MSEYGQYGVPLSITAASIVFGAMGFFMCSGLSQGVWNGRRLITSQFENISLLLRHSWFAGVRGLCSFCAVWRCVVWKRAHKQQCLLLYLPASFLSWSLTPGTQQHLKKKCPQATCMQAWKSDLQHRMGKILSAGKTLSDLVTRGYIASLHEHTAHILLMGMACFLMVHVHQESSPHLKKWKNCKWPWKLSLHHQCIFQNSNSFSKLGKKFICWKSLETGLRMGTQDLEFEIWSLRAVLLGVIPIPICHTVNGWKLDLQQEIWARICFTLQSTCKIHWDNFEIGKTQSFKELSSVDVVQRLW